MSARSERDARINRMRHALKCILMDAGLPIVGRGLNRTFDLEMAVELADFGLALEPDHAELQNEIAEYRKRKARPAHQGEQEK